MGVPPNHPFIDGSSLINHPAIRYPHQWKPPNHSPPHLTQRQAACLLKLEKWRDVEAELGPVEFTLGTRDEKVSWNGMLW